MGKLVWYKRYPDAALSGFYDLTLEERGAYGTVLDLIYAQMNNLRDDDAEMAWRLKCDIRVWRRIKKHLLKLEKIQITDERITNLRCTSEIDRHLHRVVLAQHAGRTSAERRAASKGSPPKENKDLAPADVPTDAQRTLQQNIEYRIKKDIEEAFEFWYEKYPRKVGRKAAFKAYESARRDVDAGILLAGVQRYAAEMANTEPKFIAHPRTWLHQGRWADEPTKPRLVDVFGKNEGDFGDKSFFND